MTAEQFNDIKRIIRLIEIERDKIRRAIRRSEKDKGVPVRG